jgi:hypothetical protein
LAHPTQAFNRIYSINVLESPDNPLLVAARYDTCFSYFKFIDELLDEDDSFLTPARFEPVANVPAPAGAVAQGFTTCGRQSKTMDVQGVVSWMDLTTGQLKAGFRIQIRIRINLSCWIRIRIRIQIADLDPDPGGQK